MKLKFNKKRLLMSLIEEIDQKSFIGIAVVRYGNTIQGERGICQCEVLADCISEDKIKTNVQCKWDIRELFT